MEPVDERRVRDMLEDDWHAIEAARKELESYINQVCARLSRENEFRPRLVEARPKRFGSIVDKLNAKQAGPDDLYETIADLVGARVVVYNLSDSEEFRSDVLSDGACPLGAVTDERIDYASGYRSIHLNGRIGPYGCEIQVRTAIQDAWAVTSRADVYKEGEIPLIDTLSEAQADILKGVDDVLQTIRDLREKSRLDEIEPVRAQVSDPTDSAAPPSQGLDDGLYGAAVRSLKDEERFVLEERISDARVEALKTGIEREREASGIRRLFRAAGTYERRYEYQAAARFGNKRYGFKGPFIEGSNWVEYFPNDISRGFEGFLLRQLGQLLESELTEPPMLTSWEAMMLFIAESIGHIEQANGKPDIVVVQGQLDESLDHDVMKNGDWAAARTVRGVDLTNADHVQQTIAGLPLMRIHSSSLMPSIHVVDLTQVHYIQTNPNAMTDDDLFVRVEDIDRDAATESIDRNPELKTAVFRAFNGTDGEFSREEAVLHLQLQVGMSIIEAGRIQKQDGTESMPSALVSPASQESD